MRCDSEGQQRCSITSQWKQDWTGVARTVMWSNVIFSQQETRPGQICGTEPGVDKTGPDSLTRHAVTYIANHIKFQNQGERACYHSHQFHHLQFEIPVTKASLIGVIVGPVSPSVAVKSGETKCQEILSPSSSSSQPSSSHYLSLGPTLPGDW